MDIGRFKKLEFIVPDFQGHAVRDGHSPVCRNLGKGLEQGNRLFGTVNHALGIFFTKFPQPAGVIRLHVVYHDDINVLHSQGNLFHLSGNGLGKVHDVLGQINEYVLFTLDQIRVYGSAVGNRPDSLKKVILVFNVNPKAVNIIYYFLKFHPTRLLAADCF